METVGWFMLWGMAPAVTGFVQKSYTTMIANSSSNRGNSQKLRNKKQRGGGVIPKRTVHGALVALEAPITDENIRCMEECMPGCEHGWFQSCYRSAKLHYRKWLPPPPQLPPKAVVIFMHGIGTHSGKAMVLNGQRKLNMALWADALVLQQQQQNGNGCIALYAFDLYGHGLSEGTRYWIPDSWKTNRDDYITFCKLVSTFHPDVPIFLAGESYGCTLSLLVARHFQDQTSNMKIDSVILTAPAIIGDIPPSPVYELLVFLAGCFPRWRPFFMPNPISPDRIWRDPMVRQEIANGYHRQIDGSGIPFRLGTGLNLVLALAACRDMLPEFTVPFLILHGTMDYGVPISGSELMWKTAPSRQQSRFLRLDSAYHDLLADPLAEDCMEEICKWIQERLKFK